MTSPSSGNHARAVYDAVEAAAAAATRPEADAVWLALTDAQRGQVLAMLGLSDADPGAVPHLTAIADTMHVLRSLLSDHPHLAAQLGASVSVSYESGPGDVNGQHVSDSSEATPVARLVDSAAAHLAAAQPNTLESPVPETVAASVPPESEWGWHPSDNKMLAANFDPSLIIGGSPTVTGSITCQQVKVPPGRAIESVLLEVAGEGKDLRRGGANVAAVYELDGTRVGITADQADEWLTAGFKHMRLTRPVPAAEAARRVYVCFIAAGGTRPKFGVATVSRSTRPNLGLPNRGPQLAGRITGHITCPDLIDPQRMGAHRQFWVGLG